MKLKSYYRLVMPQLEGVLDVGGAWLTAHGYQVRLIDPVPPHVETVREDGLDARELPKPTATYDGVVLTALISRWARMFEGMLRGVTDSPSSPRCGKT